MGSSETNDGLRVPWAGVQDTPSLVMPTSSRAVVTPLVSGVCALLPSCPTSALAETLSQRLSHDSKTPGSSQAFRRERDARSGCGISSSFVLGVTGVGDGSAMA